jgi:HEAT repeat protein
MLSTQAEWIAAIEEGEDCRNPLDSNLQGSLSSSDHVVRRRAAQAFGRIQSAECIVALRQLLADSSPLVRLEAIFAHGQLSWNTSITNVERDGISSDLFPFLEEKDASFRKAGLEALGKLGSASSVPQIERLLLDQDADVRSEAILACYRLRIFSPLRNDSDEITFSPALREALLSLADDADISLRRNLALLLATESCSFPLGTLLGFCASADPWTRLHSIGALRLSHPADTDSKAAVLALVGDPHPAVRLEALRGLQAMDPGSLPPPSLLADPLYFVRAEYAEALAACAEEHREQARSRALGRASAAGRGRPPAPSRAAEIPRRGEPARNGRPEARERKSREKPETRESRACGGGGGARPGLGRD